MDPNNSLLNQIVPSRLGQTEPLTVILNQIFYVGLVVAVALAVLMIVRGGIQYMTTDSIDGKGGAKLRIQAAIGGLVLAFASILILNTINPSLTRTRLDIKRIDINAGLAPGLEGNPNIITGGDNGTNGTTGSSTPPRTQDGALVAQINNINNPNAARASATGALVLNGNTYEFISGGGGNGYLPPGEYTITNGRLRSDVPSMMVDGYGYSFNLSDASDPRLGNIQRTELRIHPDGGGNGTLGCIGIEGGRDVQERFYSDMQNTLRANGGSYTIVVGR